MTPFEQSLAFHAAKLAATPVGYCKCGCGKQTTLARFTRSKDGIRKGHPINYIHGHNITRALKAHADQLRCVCRNFACEIPYGYCHCGCGEKVATAKQGSSKLGHIKGMPRKYITGHSGAIRYTQRPRAYGRINGNPIVFIPLTQNKTCIIDREDEQKVPGPWCSSHGYPAQWNRNLGKTVRIHQIILPAPSGFVTDHISGNSLDNRKCNLRVVTFTQNLQNQRVRSDNLSGVAGVRWREDRKKWEARITVFKKIIILGHFSSFEDAVRARREAELRYFGEYRRKVDK